MTLEYGNAEAAMLTWLVIKFFIVMAIVYLSVLTGFDLHDRRKMKRWQKENRRQDTLFLAYELGIIEGERRIPRRFSTRTTSSTSLLQFQ